MRLSAVFLLSLCLGQLAFGKGQKEIKSFQIGVSLKQYEYSEPSIDVSHKGILYGIWGEWLWGSALGNGRTIGDLAFGRIDYHGGYYDQNNVLRPLESTTLDVITKLTTRLEYTVAPGFSIFSGLGGRYLYDMGNGPEFYRRTGTWVYIPAGGTLNVETSLGKVFFDLQYDLIVYGRFESRLSDAVAGAPTINHTQSGYGLSLAAGMQNDDYSAGIFYETWNLNESNVVTVQTSLGEGIFVEPENSSSTFGFKIGYKF